MKWINRSFKRQILVRFFVIIAVFLGFSGSLIRIMQYEVEKDRGLRLSAQADQIEGTLTCFFRNLADTAEQLGQNELLLASLGGAAEEQRGKVYARLYAETEILRDSAKFDIYNLGGACVYSTGNTSEGSALPLYWGILRAAEKAEGKLAFLKSRDREVLRAACTLRSKEQKDVGFLVIRITAENLSHVLEEYRGISDSVILADSHWEKIYGIESERGQDLCGSLRKRMLDGDRITENYGKEHIMIRSLNVYGMYLILSGEELFTGEVLFSMYKVFFVMAVLTCLICAGAAAGFSKNLEGPVNRMNLAMKQVGEGDLSVRVSLDREDELGQMSESFNRMTGELEGLMEERVQKQKELDNSYIAVLQAQLNPHFLYNTLDTMKWVGKANGIKDISVMASGLARILRTGISSRQYHTLTQELELIACYMDIQKIRFSNQFSYEAEMEENAKDCLVPKLLLQPLVENAIIHGLKECAAARICICIQCCKERLSIRVEDNGCGMDETIRNALNSHETEQLEGHIGLRNLDTILRLRYGTEYGISAENKAGGGCAVIVELPAVRKEEDIV